MQNINPLDYEPEFPFPLPPTPDEIPDVPPEDYDDDEDWDDED